MQACVSALAAPIIRVRKKHPCQSYPSVFNINDSCNSSYCSQPLSSRLGKDIMQACVSALAAPIIRVRKKHPCQSYPSVFNINDSCNSCDSCSIKQFSNSKITAFLVGLRQISCSKNFRTFSPLRIIFAIHSTACGEGLGWGIS